MKTKLEIAKDENSALKATLESSFEDKEKQARVYLEMIDQLKSQFSKDLGKMITSTKLLQQLKPNSSSSTSHTKLSSIKLIGPNLAASSPNNDDDDDDVVVARRHQILRVH